MPPPLTGDPQIDYKYDPNLPYELIGYDLSDYPFYKRVPKEGHNFTCDGRLDGFYASIPHKCQVYYNCLFGQRYDFLCANYTVFDQVNFICQYASNVDCAASERYYDRNEELYQTTSTTTTTTPKPQIIFVERPRPIRPLGRRPLNQRNRGGQRRAQQQQSRRQEAQYYDYYDNNDYYADDYYYDEQPPAQEATTTTTTTTTTPKPARRQNRPGLRGNLRVGGNRGGGLRGGSGGGSGGGRRGNGGGGGRGDGGGRRNGEGSGGRRRQRPQGQGRRTKKPTTTTTQAPAEYADNEYYSDDYYYDDASYVDNAAPAGEPKQEAKAQPPPADRAPAPAKRQRPGLFRRPSFRRSRPDTTSTVSQNNPKETPNAPEENVLDPEAAEPKASDVANSRPRNGRPRNNPINRGNNSQNSMSGAQEAEGEETVIEEAPQVDSDSNVEEPIQTEPEAQNARRPGNRRANGRPSTSQANRLRQRPVPASVG